MEEPDLCRKRRQVMRIIKERGLRLERQGSNWRISGRGVDIVVVDLSYITHADLVRVAAQ